MTASTSTTPLQTSDLIFPDQHHHSWSQTLTQLKRATLSIHNRLNSIQHDARFVQRVAAAYHRPLVANERCGSWYIDPACKAASAYFKSTDGHTGVWDFSTRRLNLQLLDPIGAHDGVIVVDSTRRGKRMPDALSKTVSIWCCVLNRALFPDAPHAHDLYTPPQVVSRSEHAQIGVELPRFVQSFRSLALNLDDLRSRITKPLRPVWLTPESNIEPTADVFADFHPVICCTASRRVVGAEISEGGYIQGSGDDTENWAHGLTPQLFWAHQALLLAMSEEDAPAVIAQLLAASTPPHSALPPPVAPTASLIIAPLAALPSDDTSYQIRIVPELTPPESWQSTPRGLTIGLGPHKVASKHLRTALPFIADHLGRHLCQPGDVSRLVVACSTGRDAAVGVALALLCLFYADDGSLQPCDVDARAHKHTQMGKVFIRRRLGWIMTAQPDVNPSRATLQSVNSFLMKPPL